MQSVSVTESMHESSDSEFGPCVFRSDGGHRPAAQLVHLQLAGHGWLWYYDGMHTAENKRQKNGNSDRRWIILTDDGLASTISRATNPSEQDVARAEAFLTSEGFAGWLAVQSTSFHTAGSAPTFLEIRPLGSPKNTFESAVAALLARSL